MASNGIALVALERAMADYFTSAHGQKVLKDYELHMRRVREGVGADGKPLTSAQLDASKRNVERYEEITESYILAKIAQGQAEALKAAGFDIGAIIRLGSLIKSLIP